MDDNNNVGAPHFGFIRSNKGLVCMLELFIEMIGLIVLNQMDIEGYSTIDQEPISTYRILSLMHLAYFLVITKMAMAQGMYPPEGPQPRVNKDIGYINRRRLLHWLVDVVAHWATAWMLFHIKSPDSYSLEILIPLSCRVSLRIISLMKRKKKSE